MKPTMLGSNDPRRNEVISLVRRQVSAGNFTKTDVAAWKKEIDAGIVDGIIKEFAPKKKAAKKAGSKDKPAAPETKE